jgi:alanine dehydrogenase
MPIVITDEDAIRLLSIPEAIEAMEIAFRDLAQGRAVNPPRLRYSIGSPDPARRYNANIHAGAVETYRVACVRAGSNFIAADNDPKRKRRVHPEANWTVIILYDLNTGEPLAFLHETHLSGFRVGATSALAVKHAARADARVLGLFGTGHQAFHNCRAIAPPSSNGWRASPSRWSRWQTRARPWTAPISFAAPPIPRSRCSRALGSRKARC